ncbi:MAG: D-alanyl-D-alanine carboxypeptidase family protein [Hyphomonadaceae bacterium]
MRLLATIGPVALFSALAACSGPAPTGSDASAFVTPSTVPAPVTDAHLASAPPGAEPGPVTPTPETRGGVQATADNTPGTATTLGTPVTPPAPTPALTPTPPAPAKPAEAPKPSGAHVALKYLIGDIDPARDPMFAKIPEKYLGGSRVWGHKDAVAAFVRMAEDAEANGYKLKAVSAFRSFSDQKKIWEDKWNGKTIVGGKKLNVSTPDPKARALKILEFSSMPATSRHHWGTDFDINSLEPKYFNTKDGKRIYDWLTQHAPQYGFCQVYSAKGPDGRATGYEEEKWHWSYMPVASWYLKQYPIDVGYDHIAGFDGSTAAKDIDVIKTYVQSINPECKTGP